MSQTDAPGPLLVPPGAGPALDRAALDAALSRLGLPDHIELLRRRWQRVATDPWRVVQDDDRGMTHETAFTDEDALCRFLLVRALVADPPAAAHLPAVPRVVPMGEPAAGDESPPTGRTPTERWRRQLAPLSRLVARGGGTLVVEDTTSLFAHGPDGALAQVALELATGQVRWERPVWPPVAEPTVGIADDCLLSWGHGRLSARDLASGDGRWTVACEERPRLLAHTAGRAVIATGPSAEAPCPARALDLATGTTVWDAVLTHAAGPLRVDELWQLEHDDGELVLCAVALADGSRRELVRTPRPAGYEDARLAVTFAAQDEHGGLAVVRASLPPGPGVRTALGDLVLSTGADVVQIDSAPPLSGERSTVGVDAEHVLRHAETTTFRRVDDGTDRWSLPARATLHARRGGLTVLGTGRTDTTAIEDDGRVRWQRTGSVVAVSGDELWIVDGEELRGVAIETGEQHWHTRHPAAASRPWLPAGGLVGFRTNDGHAVQQRVGVLSAYG